jgi:predicted transposase/invertase (TIGR01784 family)
LAYISKVNKRNDYAFKRIFGHEDTKDILARFLTVMLNVPIEPEELTLIHTEMSPEYLADKASVLDIQVKRGSRHEKMNIEMQVGDEGNIRKRILHYWGRGYTEELREGQSYDDLPRMINIVIVDFDVFEWRDLEKFHSVFNVIERDEGVLFCDALEIHVIELPKLRRRPIRNDWTPDECWALYIDNMEGEAMERIADMEPLIKRAMTVEDIFIKNDEERRLYELREKGRRIYESAIRKAERDGREEGKAIGREEGEAKGRAAEKEQTARSMLANDVSYEIISKVTGFSIEEINALMPPNNSD